MSQALLLRWAVFSSISVLRRQVWSILALIGSWLQRKTLGWGSGPIKPNSLLGWPWSSRLDSLYCSQQVGKPLTSDLPLRPHFPSKA